MNKVYAVSTGIYSDYSVVAIFTTMELAQDFMDAVPSDYYNDVEEFDLNPDTANLIKQGYSPWSVHMLRDGTTEKVSRYEPSAHNTASEFNIWRRSKAMAYKGKGIKDALACYVMAKSAEHAIKIVNEKRIQMIANGEWEAE